MNNIKKIDTFFQDNTRKMKKNDWLIVGVMILIYSIVSFINLGSTKNPQTFKKFARYDNSVVFKIDEEPQYISKMRHYAGKEGGSYIIMGSTDNENYEKIISFTDESAFRWDDISINKKTKYLKIFPMTEGRYIGEIQLYNKNGEKMQVTAESEDAQKLIDEPDTVPEKIDYTNGTYFDEVYFPRTAYEYAHGMQAYEWVHPPLGKLLQMVSIMLFGMTPFAYRLLGNIAGILMIIVMYAFGKSLFKSRKYALLSGMLMMFDNFHFVQTRIGTVDSFLVLFIITSAFYMFQYLQLNKEESLKKKNKYLFFSGLFFGLATCVKWTGLYLGLGLCILFFGKLIIDIIKDKKLDKSYIEIILACIGYFVIIPCTIYVLSYFLFPNVSPKQVSNFSELFDQIEAMYKYHSTLVAEHPFTSKWYTWPALIRPIWYYASTEASGLAEGIRSTIVAIGNPSIWWVGSITSIFVLLKAIWKRKKEDIFIVVLMLAMWIPYAFIGRIMFLYHFFPVLPFMMLAIVSFIKSIEKKKKWNWITITYMIIIIVVFSIFYPVSSGMPVSEDYIESVKWLSTWQF